MTSNTSFLSRPGPILMGILNVTPDSFSDGGSFFSLERAIEHALAMIAEGADIIDIGGESTRPPGSTYGVGAEAVTLEQELTRVIPAIEAIRLENAKILISIDTQKSEVAKAAIDAGANIINDVSAGTSDSEMFAIAAERNVPIILMHGHGPRFTKARIEDYSYEDVIREVYDYLAERIDAARAAGISEILADVGIGFAKGYGDNLTLLKHHAQFLSLSVPLVLGVSRKSTIGRAMAPPNSSTSEGGVGWGVVSPGERLIGSLAAACYGVPHGAKIIRTHDVKATREALNVIGAIITS